MIRRWDLPINLVPVQECVAVINIMQIHYSIWAAVFLSELDSHPTISNYKALYPSKCENGVGLICDVCFRGTNGLFYVLIKFLWNMCIIIKVYCMFCLYIYNQNVKVFLHDLCISQKPDSHVGTIWIQHDYSS